MVFAEVEGGGADQVADVLDQEEVGPVEVEGIERVQHHVRVEVATGPGVDLLDRGAGGGDPDRIVVGLLVPFDHRRGKAAGQVLQGPLQDGGLAGTGGADQVQHEHPLRAEQGTVTLGQPVVLGEDVGLDGQFSRRLDCRAVPMGVAVQLTVVLVGVNMDVVDFMDFIDIMDMGMVVTVVVVVIICRRTAAINAHSRSTSKNFHEPTALVGEPSTYPQKGQGERAPLPDTTPARPRPSSCSAAILSGPNGGRAHSSSSSRTLSSSPETISRPKAPQSGQGSKRLATAPLLPQRRQLPTPGTSSNRSLAPSRSVPRVHASKQNSILSGTTPASAPISRTTSITRCPAACRSQISTTLWIMDISCSTGLRRHRTGMAG